MSVIGVDGYRTSLARPLNAADTEIQLRRQDAIKLNVVGVGNWTYLTIWDPVKTEVVRYDHVQDWDATDPAVVGLAVQRDMAGLGLRSFAYGSCVEFRVTSFHLEDLMTGCFEAPSLPAASEDPALPTVVVGGRGMLLGEPAGYVEQCPGKFMPYYLLGE